MSRPRSRGGDLDQVAEPAALVQHVVETAVLVDAHPAGHVHGRPCGFEGAHGLPRVVAAYLQVVEAGTVLVEEVAVRARAGRREHLHV